LNPARGGEGETRNQNRRAKQRTKKNHKSSHPPGEEKERGGKPFKGGSLKGRNLIPSGSTNRRFKKTN